MELKGFKTQERSIAVVAVAFGLVTAVGGLTAPVAMAQDVETWTMPALEEEVLQDAVDATIEAAGPENVKFNVYDSVFNQVVYNYTNWIVCGQSPEADSTVEINPTKPQTVTLALARPSAGC